MVRPPEASTTCRSSLERGERLAVGGQHHVARPAARRRWPATAARHPAPSAAAGRARSAPASRRRARRAPASGPAGSSPAPRGRDPRSPPPSAPFTASEDVAQARAAARRPAAPRSRPPSGARSAPPARARCRRRPRSVSRKLNDRPGQHRQHPPPHRGAVEARPAAPRGSSAPAPRDRLRLAPSLSPRNLT